MGWGPLIPINSVFFQTANLLGLLCFIQLDMMYLRMVRICSDIFFVLFGIFTLYIGLDAIIWNLLFVVVDTVYLIPLVKQRMPIKLSKQEEAFYKTVKKYLTKFQFKMLIDNGEERKYHVCGSQICLEGNPCDEIILIFRIPEGKSVVLYKNKKKIMTVQEGSFIGHIEFISKATGDTYTHQNSNVSETSVSNTKWNISWVVENTGDENTVIDWEDEIYDSDLDSESDYDPDSILCFKWDFKRMKTLFGDKEHGRIFENGMYSLWLKSVSEYILRQSMEIYEQKVMKSEYKRRLSILSPQSSIKGLKTNKNLDISSSSSSTSEIKDDTRSNKQIVMKKIQSGKDGNLFTPKMNKFRNSPQVHSENHFTFLGSLTKPKDKKNAKHERKKLYVKHDYIKSDSQPVSVVMSPALHTPELRGDPEYIAKSKSQFKQVKKSILQGKKNPKLRVDRKLSSHIIDQKWVGLKGVKKIHKEIVNEPGASRNDSNSNFNS